jgi:hypothetical protein
MDWMGWTRHSRPVFNSPWPASLCKIAPCLGVGQRHSLQLTRDIAEIASSFRATYAAQVKLAIRTCTREYISRPESSPVSQIPRKSGAPSPSRDREGRRLSPFADVPSPHGPGQLAGDPGTAKLRASAERQEIPTPHNTLTFHIFPAERRLARHVSSRCHANAPISAKYRAPPASQPAQNARGAWQIAPPLLLSPPVSHVSCALIVGFTIRVCGLVESWTGEVGVG